MYLQFFIKINVYLNETKPQQKIVFSIKIDIFRLGRTK